MIAVAIWCQLRLKRIHTSLITGPTVIMSMLVTCPILNYVSIYVLTQYDLIHIPLLVLVPPHGGSHIPANPMQDDSEQRESHISLNSL